MLLGTCSVIEAGRSFAEFAETGTSVVCWSVEISVTGSSEDANGSVSGDDTTTSTSIDV
jgi:hypothetical protein